MQDHLTLGTGQASPGTTSCLTQHIGRAAQAPGITTWHAGLPNTKTSILSARCLHMVAQAWLTPRARASQPYCHVALRFDPMQGQVSLSALCPHMRVRVWLISRAAPSKLEVIIFFPIIFSMSNAS